LISSIGAKGAATPVVAEGSAPRRGTMKEFEDRVSSLMWGSRTSNAGPPPRKTILAISGGKGGGHKAPMAGVLGKLARDTQVNVHSKVDFDVGNFVDPNRGLLDDALYKASNNAPGTAVATRWRKENSQKATYQAVSNWLALPQHQDGTLLYTNHRILGNAAADVAPAATAVVISTADPGKIHQGWYPQRLKQPGTNDVLLVPGLEGMKHAWKAGVPPERIVDLGYPVREAFEQVASLSKAELREELGLPSDKKVLLMSVGGGKWPNYFVGLLKALAADGRAGDLHIVAVAGSNAALKTTLEALNPPLGTVYGNCDASLMARLTRAADLVGTKAGGASLGECYATQAVPIVYQMLSGVEHGNVKHVKKHHTGVIALDKRKFVDAVFNTSDAQIQAIRQNQAAFRTVGSAQRIADFLGEKAGGTQVPLVDGARIAKVTQQQRNVPVLGRFLPKKPVLTQEEVGRAPTDSGASAR
jgi:hypothetical protein